MSTWSISDENNWILSYPHQVISLFYDTILQIFSSNSKYINWSISVKEFHLYTCDGVLFLVLLTFRLVFLPLSLLVIIFKPFVHESISNYIYKKLLCKNGNLSDFAFRSISKCINADFSCWRESHYRARFVARFEHTRLDDTICILRCDIKELFWFGDNLYYCDTAAMCYCELRKLN